MTSVTYYGHTIMTYPHYIDTATGKSLVCHPGQTYSIIAASGSLLSAASPAPSDGRFALGLGANAVPAKKVKGRTPAAG